MQGTQRRRGRRLAINCLYLTVNAIFGAPMPPGARGAHEAAVNVTAQGAVGALSAALV